jgi:hypothetical protein
MTDATNCYQLAVVITIALRGQRQFHALSTSWDSTALSNLLYTDECTCLCADFAALSFDAQEATDIGHAQEAARTSVSQQERPKILRLIREHRLVGHTRRYASVGLRIDCLLVPQFDDRR